MTDFPLSAETLDPGTLSFTDATEGGTLPAFEAPLQTDDAVSAAPLASDFTEDASSFFSDPMFGFQDPASSGAQPTDGAFGPPIVAQASDGAQSADPGFKFGTAVVTGGASTPFGTAFGLTPEDGNGGLEFADSKLFLGTPGGGLVGTFQPSTGNVGVGLGAGAPIPGTGVTGFANGRLEFTNPFDNPNDGVAAPGQEPSYLNIGENWRIPFDNPFDGDGRSFEWPDLSFNAGWFKPGAAGTSLGTGFSATVTEPEQGLDPGFSPWFNPLGVP